MQNDASRQVRSKQICNAVVLNPELLLEHIFWLQATTTLHKTKKSAYTTFRSIARTKVKFATVSDIVINNH